MRIHEYRITLPMTEEEYYVGNLFSQVKTRQMDDKQPIDRVRLVQEVDLGNDGFVYTQQLTSASTRIPHLLAAILPNIDDIYLKWERWENFRNAGREEVSCDYFGDSFKVKIFYYTRPDRGESENVFDHLPKKIVDNRKIHHFDLLEPVFDEGEDFSTFRSKKGGVGPLDADWKQKTDSVTTIYCLFIAQFTFSIIDPINEKVLNSIVKSTELEFVKLAHRIVVWMDLWHGLSIPDLLYQRRLLLDSDVRRQEKEK